jgi:hypothetical protein
VINISKHVKYNRVSQNPSHTDFIVLHVSAKRYCRKGSMQKYLIYSTIDVGEVGWGTDWIDMAQHRQC